RSRDGSFVVLADDAVVPEPRTCVLLRWLEGRFADRRLRPVHLHRVGILEARLHEHAARWAPPRGFLRPRVATLSDAGKIESIAPTAAAGLVGDHPTREDADRGLHLVDALVSRGAAELFSRALYLVWVTTRKLAE